MKYPAHASVVSPVRRRTPAFVLWAALALAPGAIAQWGGLAQGPGAQAVQVFSAPVPPNAVGLFEVQVSHEPQFLLRGTLPVPKGTFDGTPAKGGFAIVDAGGALVPAQVEIASRYPKPEDGADVVELIARVRRPAGVTPTARVAYPVVRTTAPPPSAGLPVEPLDALTVGPIGLPGGVAELLAAPGNLRVEAVDAFGHRYRADLLSPSAIAQVRKHGPMHSQVRVSTNLLPVLPVGGATGTLPHSFGLHAYLGTHSGEPVLTLDLRVHNAHDGHNPLDPADDPLGKVYFERIDLLVPLGYHILEAFDAPLTGATSFEGNWLRWSLVEPLPEGKLHVMGPQAQFHRRLAIARYGSLPRAMALLRQEGTAFARRGSTPSGARLWSWWNPDTARWFPQNFVLPHLEHVGIGGLRSKLEGDFRWIERRYEMGLGVGNYPVVSDRMGWSHPFGIAYGGMTGGTEIHLVDGVREMEAASLAGLRRAELLHLMHTDRQSNALYHHSGRPTRLEDWVVQANPPHVPFGFYMKLQGPNDPFGFQNAPTFQVEAVLAQGRAPDYEAELLSYQPHDLQHLVRYTRSAKVLAWAKNDSLAVDDLLMQAELVRLSYHTYPNSSGGFKDSTGMLYDIEHVIQWPGRGMDFGRGEAWGADTMAAAYALGSPAWRDQVYGWFFDLTATVLHAVVPCTGHIQARVQQKLLEGKYRAAQSFEDSIVHNGLRGVVESVFRGRQAGFAAMLDDTLRQSYWAFVGPLQWNEALNGPKDGYAVGPKEISQGVWCFASQQPADGFLPTVNTYQTFSTLGYAFDLTQSPFFLQRAAQMLGPNALAKLYGDGDKNVENRAALLAVVQQLLGEL